MDIKGCRKCPYCIYNSDYGMSYDSGWDCDHGDTNNSRIVDEGATTPKERAKSAKKVDEALNTVPDWCPLPDKEEEEEFKPECKTCNDKK